MRAASWTKLAAFLLDDKDGSKTANIKEKNNHDVDDCCAEMICEYLQSGDVSWQHVLKILREADYSNLASDMEKDLDIKSMWEVMGNVLSCAMCKKGSNLYIQKHIKHCTITLI